MDSRRPTEHLALIALGANLGDRKRSLDSAIAILRENPQIRVERVSSFIESKAVGGPVGQPDFLNGAAQLSTQLSPGDILKTLLETEAALGRDRSVDGRNLPRTIDLDLLLYDDFVMARADLIVPHPRLHERDFVLIPLIEIAPQAVHPVLHKTIEELWSDWRRDHRPL